MALSGVKTVTTAGTAVKLGTQDVCGPLLVKALSTNSGLIYIGNVSEDVASTNGLTLAAGQEVYFNYVGNLASVWIDSSVNGEGVAWLILKA